MRGVTSSDQIGLGPILKHPNIQRFFAPPPSIIAVPVVTTADVVSSLQKYHMQHHPIQVLPCQVLFVLICWQIPEFMKYFAEVMGVPSPQHLCVRIQGVG